MGTEDRITTSSSALTLRAAPALRMKRWENRLRPTRIWRIPSISFSSVSTSTALRHRFTRKDLTVSTSRSPVFPALKRPTRSSTNWVSPALCISSDRQMRAETRTISLARMLTAMSTMYLPRISSRSSRTATQSWKVPMCRKLKPATRTTT